MTSYSNSIDKPNLPPTSPHDPLDPERDPSIIPLPPDTNPQPREPVREPDDPVPVVDPEPREPTRLMC